MLLALSVMGGEGWKQMDVLLPLVHGRDAFVRMATGAGKSLCMFLAPLAIGPESAIGVIISPLNALMDQQVHYEEDYIIPCAV